jgi:Homeodomain-like domain
MARAYSADMRQRVIDRVENGASRREAAEHYEVSPSTAVIWVKCFRETGRCAAKPRGGSTSPLCEAAEQGSCRHARKNLPVGRQTGPACDFEPHPAYAARRPRPLHDLPTRALPRGLKAGWRQYCKPVPMRSRPR